MARLMTPVGLNSCAMLRRRVGVQVIQLIGSTAMNTATADTERIYVFPYHVVNATRL